VGHATAVLIRRRVAQWRNSWLWEIDWALSSQDRLSAVAKMLSVTGHFPLAVVLAHKNQ
jgi:hypothetical protein